MHPIENILNITMSELKEMVDVNTVVGSPFVSPSGCTIIPISKVSFGFVTGGGEYGDSINKGRENQNLANNGFPFAGGSASGVTITPVAFMAADKENIKLLTACQRSVVDKVLENIPQMMCELKEMIGCGKEDCKGNEQGSNSEDQED